MPSVGEVWSIGAHRYVDHVAEITGAGGEALLKLIEKSRPFTKDSKVLETGAGTGATTKFLRNRNPEMVIVAGDPSSGMLEQFKGLNLHNVEPLILDATEDHVARGLQENSFSHVLSTFVLQFVAPKTQTAVDEMYRLLQSGGVVGNTLWVKAVFMDAWNIACKNLDPTFEPVTTAFADALRVPQDLEKLYVQAGFKDVHSEEVELYWKFPDAETFADYFLHSQNPPFIKTQSSWKGRPIEVREELIKVVREQYDNGRFLMVSGAVVGTKP